MFEPDSPLVVFPSIMATLFFGTALLRGTWRHLSDLFGLAFKVAEYKRRNKPFSAAEQAVHAVTAMILSDPEQWQLVEAKDRDSYYEDKIMLERSDGKIRVYNPCMSKVIYHEFYGFTGPRVWVDGIGDYTLEDVRPELTRDLAKAFTDLRYFRACNILVSQPTERIDSQ